MFSLKPVVVGIVSKPMDADEIIRSLGLAPHPEGGHYRETFRDSKIVDDRSASTAIYFLLKAGETSHWHQVDAVEIWHYYAGASLQISISVDGNPTQVHHLGPTLEKDEVPQVVVPAFSWQSAKSMGDWTLVGCTVAPGFEFSGFTLAPTDWTPD